MKKILLNLYFWPAFILTTIVGLILLPVILLINLLFFGKRVASVLRFAIRLYGWVLVCVVPFMAPVRVIGDTSKIPRPCIMTANHASAIDPYLFGAIPIENCFVTSWPFKIPLYGPLMKLAGYINTNDGWESIRQQCAIRLDEGASLSIWPEGHRSRNGLMGRFRKGAFQVAVETGYPIQPICIIGSADIMSPGEHVLSPGRAKLVLLEPLFPDRDGNSPEDSIKNLRKRTFTAIQMCLKEYQNHGKSERHRTNGDDLRMSSKKFNQQSHDAC